MKRKTSLLFSFLGGELTKTIKTPFAKRKFAKRQSLKAFTLMELVIVIAIVAVLLSMTTFFANGYINDAKQLTRNEQAELIYTNATNMLVDLEISQDLQQITASYVDEAKKANLISNMVIFTDFDNGKINLTKGITVQPVFKTNTLSVQTNPAAKQLLSTSTDEAELRTYKYLESMLTESLQKDFNGSVYIAIDVENYNVQSSIYIEDEISGLDYFTSTLKLNKYKFTETVCKSEFFSSTDIVSQ